MQYDKLKWSHCFVARDMFAKFNFKTLQSWRKSVKKRRAFEHNDDFAANILTYCFSLIILDIIENNVTFVVPAVGRKAYIYVKPITGEKFEYLYRMGTFDGLDYLKTNFTGYRLMYQYQTSKEVKEKPIYISKELKQRLFKNANEGMVYY